MVSRKNKIVRKKEKLRSLSDLEIQMFFTFNDGNIHGRLAYQLVPGSRRGRDMNDYGYLLISDENRVAQLPVNKIGLIYGRFLEVEMNCGELQWH